uniref:Secreted protein n=1 Tax=Parascaris equorum TaxID=6256 RepID=A0A914RHC0_PAREQ
MRYIHLFVAYPNLFGSFVCHVRCCQFVKRSAETGFSISNTRPLGPPTPSLSDDGLRNKNFQYLPICI